MRGVSIVCSFSRHETTCNYASVFEANLDRLDDGKKHIWYLSNRFQVSRCFNVNSDFTISTCSAPYGGVHFKGLVGGKGQRHIAIVVKLPRFQFLKRPLTFPVFELFRYLATSLKIFKYISNMWN